MVEQCAAEAAGNDMVQYHLAELRLIIIPVRVRIDEGIVHVL